MSELCKEKETKNKNIKLKSKETKTQKEKVDERNETIGRRGKL